MICGQQVDEQKDGRVVEGEVSPVRDPWGHGCRQALCEHLAHVGLGAQVVGGPILLAPLSLSTDSADSQRIPAGVPTPPVPGPHRLCTRGMIWCTGRQADARAWKRDRAPIP